MDSSQNERTLNGLIFLYVLNQPFHNPTQSRPTHTKRRTYMYYIYLDDTCHYASKQSYWVLCWRQTKIVHKTGKRRKGNAVFEVKVA